MATFAKSTFSAGSYAAFRPIYPTALYNKVLAYHRGPKKLCLDLGCGTGIVTREMAQRFERAIGSDPSPGMVRQAREQLTADTKNISYEQAPAESSPFVGDGQVDCVVAGQAAHWFDYTKLWPELDRILRPGGTVAFWGYKDPVFVDFPKASKILDELSYSQDPDMLGSYWPQPGRSYVQDKLRVIQPLSADWEDVERVEYEPECRGRRSGDGTIFMERKATIAATKAYMRTASSFHGWQEVHPDQVARDKGGNGDVVDRMFDLMGDEDESLKDESTEVWMEWGSGLVMARKK